MKIHRIAIAGALLSRAVLASPEAQTGAAQKDRPRLRDEVRRYREGAEANILAELAAFVALPNVAKDKANIERNARHLITMLKRRGVEGRLLEQTGAPPAVYAELRAPSAKRTVVFYAHYDGQPVDPAQWTGSPWKPVLRDKPLEEGGRDIPMPRRGARVSDEARLYGRATSDDKAAIVAMLTALDALRAARVSPSVNLKFYFEGEEEAGSPHLRSSLERNRDLLRADAWLFCDGPVHQSRRPQVVYGARGVVPLELTVYGATRSLHSGHYGNWAPNPASLLSALLASMRDANGRVTIAGFYDPVRPLSDLERRAVDAIPNVDVDLRRSFGLAHTESDDARLADRVTQPGLNIRGLLAGHVGAQAANAIPTEARASIDFRLVPDQTPDGIKAAVERHLRAQGFQMVHDAPDVETRTANARIVRVNWEAGYPGFRTSMDLPFSRAVASVVSEALGGDVIRVPNLGGSLPLYLLEEVLHVPVVIIPIANHDNNQHAANENLRLHNLWDGIDIFAGMFTRLDAAWSAAESSASAKPR